MKARAEYSLFLFSIQLPHSQFIGLPSLAAIVFMLQDPLSALRYRPFRFFILARLFATFAFNFQATCVGWQVYSITHDAFALGFVGLMEAIPFIVTSLFGGHVADIVNRQRILVVAMIAYLACALLLLWSSYNMEGLLASANAWPVYGIIFLTGIARGFLSPAMFAFMGQIVPREEYANAATWNSTAWQVGAVTGPAIGGLVYGFFGMHEAYILNAACFLIAALCFSGIPYTHISKEGVRQNIFESIGSGIRFVKNQQVLLAALSLDLFAVLFGGAVALLPVFCSEILKTGPAGLGVLRSAPALGAVLMAAVLAFYPLKQHAGKWLLLSVGLFGLCTIGFALSSIFWISFLCLALTGAFDNVSVVLRQTIVQLNTPDEMRGRVSSVNSIFIGSSNEIGAFESGLAAKLLGLVPSVVFGGLATIGVVGVAARFAPKLRALNLTEEK